MKAKEVLKRAKEYIFSTGLGDSAAHLCRENIVFGLAKMHMLQKKLGLKPNATFISSPDETTTRNVGRWNQGIGYGGKLSWGDGKDKVVILDVKPNTCGMLVGQVSKVPHPKELIKAVYNLEKKKTAINGIPVKWDFNKGNHFIDVFKVGESELKLKDYVIIVHAGGPEIKADNLKGFGLYFDESETLQTMYSKLDTPFGPIYYLTDSDAKAYMKFYEFAEDFAKKRREYVFKKVFKGKIICNHCHQGMLNYNEIVLGSHFIRSEKEIFPISIRADLPSYLVRGKKNFTEEQIESLGFNKRANKLGVRHRLRKANILPHGGGYTFLDSLTVSNVFQVNGSRFFELDLADGLGKKIISDVRAIQYSYRNREVITRTVELGLAEIKAELIPLYALKI